MDDDDPTGELDGEQVDPAALHAAAETVIDRLSELAERLTPLERSILASLLAPAISMAGDEVTGFAATHWLAGLPGGVDSAIQHRRVRVVDAG